MYSPYYYAPYDYYPYGSYRAFPSVIVANGNDNDDDDNKTVIVPINNPGPDWSIYIFLAILAVIVLMVLQRR